VGAKRSIASGTEQLLFGKLEHAVRWFHEALETVTSRK